MSDNVKPISDADPLDASTVDSPIASEATLAAPLESAETLAAPFESANTMAANPSEDATLAARPNTPTLASGETPPRGEMTDLARVPHDSYDIGSELARGGMGRIMHARDRRLRRDVALKVLRSVAAGTARRFEREVYITARLQHPSIVRVYEAGLLEDGQPFYAMEKVRGESLDHVIASAKNLDDRLALLPHVISVAEALAYAHNERIIHRDLKPANILVGKFGETVVIDWGLAKDLRATDEDDSGESSIAFEASESTEGLTAFGSVLGTPAYMSPEQARGDSADERSDVYAIGVLLYTLLAGEPPFRGGSSGEVIDKVSKGMSRPLAELHDGVPEELRTIVDRAMALDATRRYDTAGELADDLRRFETGQLVGAHEYSRATLFARWARRHRAAMTVAAVAVVALAIGATLSVRSIVRERDRADHLRVVAETAQQDSERRRVESERRADDIVLRQARNALSTDPSTAIAWLIELSGSDRWDEAHRIAAEAYAQGISNVMVGHGDDVENVTIVDAERFVAGSDDGTAFVWTIVDGSSLELRGHDGPVEAIAVSPDRAIVATGGADRTLRLWPLAGGEPTVLRVHTDAVLGCAFSPDGREIVTTSSDRTVRLWDVATGTSTVIARHSDTTRPIAFSADGGSIMYGGGDGIVGVWDRETNHVRRLRAHSAEVRAISVSSDDSLIVSGAEDGFVNLWTFAGENLGRLGAHADLVRDVIIVPGNQLVVSAGGDREVRVYDIATRSERAFTGNESGVKDLAVSPDGRFVASAGIDGRVRVYPLAGGETLTLAGHAAAVKSVAFTPDGSVVISGSDDNSVRTWRLERDDPPPRGPDLADWAARQTNVRVAHPLDVE